MTVHSALHFAPTMKYCAIQALNDSSSRTLLPALRPQVAVDTSASIVPGRQQLLVSALLHGLPTMKHQNVLASTIVDKR